MGCDIHMAVERQDQNGVWHNVPSVPEYETWRGEKTTEIYGCRNYSVFGMLAGVRESMPLIAQPRGVPDDVSDEARACLSNGHTPSWLLLSEVQAHLTKHENTRRVRSGFVEFQGFKTYREKGCPNSWCGGVGGGLVKIVTPDVMQDLLDGETTREPKISYYTHITWIENVLDSLGVFVDFVDACMQLGDPERTRLVFDFDS
jgi:hypothetical protein